MGANYILAPPTTPVQYGLEWFGDGVSRKMLYWDNPFPIYDATYIFKILPHDGVPRPWNSYTTFFWGNRGTFIWDGGNANTYYGAHPHPTPPQDGPGQFEISAFAQDPVTGVEVDWDRWHTQVFRAWRTSSTATHHEFYYDLPDEGKFLDLDVNDANWASIDPPQPAIMIGQAPDDGSGLQSWGGYPGWEEFVGVIRGIQIYSEVLTLADALLEIEQPKSTAAGAASIWYLNVDPKADDVADKKNSGAPNNPSWSLGPASTWSGTGSP